MDAVRRLDPRRSSRLELAVFVSGVVSMGLEIMAGRMIAPQFGSSIYTWGSIIGVFLAALSYGYHRGGREAAEWASEQRIARLALFTALYIAGVVAAGDLLLRSAAAAPLPPRFASMPAILLLFAPPTFFLGYVSPYAAQLSAKDGVGRASGHVYAVGTVGSIVGAFGTTFVLIPALDVALIGLVFGLLLVVTAAGLVGRDGALRRQAAVLLVGAVVVAASGASVAGIDVEGHTVYETQTAYQHLEVVDRGDVRTLYLDGQTHSAMDLDDPTRHVLDYTRYFHLPYLVADDPDAIDRVLFVGGGGFTGPKRFLADDPDVRVDVVELDPAVIDVAQRYFRVEPSERLTIHQGDGRRFLRETDHTYDLIVLDAYRKDKVPFHLTTVEFVRLASDRLDDDGILFANLIAAPSGPASGFYRAEYRTIDRVFPRVYSFPTVGGVAVQNVEIVATKRDALLTEDELLERNERRDVAVDLADAIEAYRRDEPTDDVPVLRDDRAPVDALLDPAAGQRYVVERADPNATATGDAGGDGTGTGAASAP